MRRILFATALAGIATAWAQEPAKVTFMPAREVAAALQSARPEAPGVAVARVTEGPNYHVLLVRRTAPGPAEVDRDWSEIWYVIRGTGVLSTGGSLAGRAFAGGDAHRIAKGDVITIPAGVPQRVRSIDGNGVDYMLVKFQAARDTDPARNNTRIWFYSAAQIDSAAHNAPGSRLTPGNYGVSLDSNAGYDNGINRRTAPGTAHADKGWSEVWYVIVGSGVQVTGGTLVNPRPGHAGELRSSEISGGEERRIAPGDMIIVPAGVPHWVRSIDGKEITYFSPKIASPK
jgi:mannose-6-phosphate isomerase-like protein (cupin superfamily)